MPTAWILAFVARLAVGVMEQAVWLVFLALAAYQPVLATLCMKEPSFKGVIRPNRFFKSQKRPCHTSVDTSGLCCELVHVSFIDLQNSNHDRDKCAISETKTP